MAEIWKDIKGYEGLYMVSNIGRVLSLSKKVKRGRGYWIKPNRILNPYYSHNRYAIIHLRDRYGAPSLHYIHRLVANAFLDNPNDFDWVNHKDENKQNNNANNLEWCTPKYNLSYGSRKQGTGCCKTRCVLQYSKDGELINSFASIKQAATAIGISHHGNISKNCLGKIKTAYGYIWEYNTKL